MPSVLAKLRETGRVLVCQSEKGHYSHICFSRWQQIAILPNSSATNCYTSREGLPYFRRALRLPNSSSVSRRLTGSRSYRNFDNLRLCSRK
ncbi:hypothetical protein T265_02248 [Opisthorchis viverrini]|uniref:Uncharacterized protein n=1 Tax=Opisthorchis viverrini TaxID=6198 RepID=A0A075A730_OPIVI|nr:hypothetical protein T265_02248 [Opisthorchis viverrini]KER31475.1 hypothetical protein T265_02248 [Opisthorchis viverrini]